MKEKSRMVWPVLYVHQDQTRTTNSKHGRLVLSYSHVLSTLMKCKTNNFHCNCEISRCRRDKKILNDCDFIIVNDFGIIRCPRRVSRRFTTCKKSLKIFVSKDYEKLLWIVEIRERRKDSKKNCKLTIFGWEDAWLLRCFILVRKMPALLRKNAGRRVGACTVRDKIHVSYVKILFFNFI